MNSDTLSSTNRAESPLVSAFRQTLPIILGYVPVGFAYGVLAQKSGLSGINTILMSLLVFAGSAQLIAVGLFAAKAAPLAIVATTFVVNLRHLLMSAALAPYLRGWSKSRLALFSYQLTDETFALHVGRFAKGETGPGRPSASTSSPRAPGSAARSWALPQARSSPTSGPSALITPCRPCSSPCCWVSSSRGSTSPWLLSRASCPLS